MMEKQYFKAMNENGVETNYEIVSLIESEDGIKKFICYTDNVIENDRNRMFISLYEIENEDIIIKPITKQSDWDFITEQFKGR